MIFEIDGIQLNLSNSVASLYMGLDTIAEDLSTDMIIKVDNSSKAKLEFILTLITSDSYSDDLKSVKRFEEIHWKYENSQNKIKELQSTIKMLEEELSSVKDNLNLFVSRALGSFPTYQMPQQQVVLQPIQQNSINQEQQRDKVEKQISQASTIEISKKQEPQERDVLKLLSAGDLFG